MFTCENCNKQYLKEVSLIKHKISCNKTFICNGCNREIKSKQAYESHIQVCKKKQKSNLEEELEKRTIEINQLRQEIIVLIDDNIRLKNELREALNNQTIIDSNNTINYIVNLCYNSRQFELFHKTCADTNKEYARELARVFDRQDLFPQVTDEQ